MVFFEKFVVADSNQIAVSYSIGSEKEQVSLKGNECFTDYVSEKIVKVDKYVF
jgi:hypothetical protein